MLSGSQEQRRLHVIGLSFCVLRHVWAADDRQTRLGRPQKDDPLVVHVFSVCVLACGCTDKIGSIILVCVLAGDDSGFYEAQVSVGPLTNPLA